MSHQARPFWRDPWRREKCFLTAGVESSTHYTHAELLSFIKSSAPGRLCSGSQPKPVGLDRRARSWVDGYSRVEIEIVTRDGYERKWLKSQKHAGCSGSRWVVNGSRWGSMKEGRWSGGR